MRRNRYATTHWEYKEFGMNKENYLTLRETEKCLKVSRKGLRNLIRFLGLPVEKVRIRGRTVYAVGAVNLIAFMNHVM